MGTQLDRSFAPPGDKSATTVQPHIILRVYAETAAEVEDDVNRDANAIKQDPQLPKWIKSKQSSQVH